MRQDVCHTPVGKRLYQSCAADELLGLILRAPVPGEEPVIRTDDLGGYQTLEQFLDTRMCRACCYHQPAPQTGHRAWQAQQRSVADH